jgi:hypothetical protein
LSKQEIRTMGNRDVYPILYPENVRNGIYYLKLGLRDVSETFPIFINID